MLLIHKGVDEIGQIFFLNLVFNTQIIVMTCVINKNKGQFTIKYHNFYIVNINHIIFNDSINFEIKIM